MIDLLGLPSLRLLGFTENAERITIKVEPSQPFRCKSHPDAKLHSGGKSVRLGGLADLPMRGKPVTINVYYKPFDCSICQKSAYLRPADLDPVAAMTRRLVSFVEDALLRRTMVDIQGETGLSVRQIGTIATKLVAKLHAVRFPTPDILAMDGIEVSGKKRFQIVTDGRTGLPIAVFGGWDSAAALRELPNHIDMKAVRVLVTDMHRAYKTVAKHMGSALHVADKFHVIDKVNTGVFRVIGDQIDTLTAQGKVLDAKRLRAHQQALAGYRTVAPGKSAQMELDLERLPQKFSRYESVNDAHAARWQMLEFYRSPDRKVARQRLAEFVKRAQVSTISDRMAEAVRYVTNGRPRILNYFDALEDVGGGTIWGPTTSAAERRNGTLQDLWNKSRGFNGKRGDEQFRLKAIFHPYRLGGHLIECGECGIIEGPERDVRVVAQRLTGQVVLPQDQRCSTCRNEKTPPQA